MMNSALKDEDKVKVFGFYSHVPGKPGCEFSNFWPCRYTFTLPDFCQGPGYDEQVEVAWAEQAIMLAKAALMKDLETFGKLKAGVNTPGKAKQLGRKAMSTTTITILTTR